MKLELPRARFSVLSRDIRTRAPRKVLTISWSHKNGTGWSVRHFFLFVSHSSCLCLTSPFIWFWTEPSQPSSIADLVKLKESASLTGWSQNRIRYETNPNGQQLPFGFAFTPSKKRTLENTSQESRIVKGSPKETSPVKRRLSGSICSDTYPLHIMFSHFRGWPSGFGTSHVPSLAALNCALPSEGRSQF